MLYMRILLFTIALLSFDSAIARPWYIEPDISSSIGYDDNPSLTSGSDRDLTDSSLSSDEVEDQSFVHIGGGIRIGSETEGDLIALDLSGTGRRFSESELDSESVGISALYQKNGIKTDFDFETGFSRDSTLETELIDTGRLEENVDRDEVYIDSSLIERLSERLIGDVTLGYRDISFDSDADSFTNFEEFTAAAELERIISNRTTAFGLIEYISVRPTGIVDLGDIERDDFASLQAGFTYNLTEPLEILLSIGRGRIDTDLSGENGVVNFNSNNTVYNVELDYTGKRNSLGAEFSNSFEGSASGGLSETESFNVSFSRPETLGGTFNLTAGYTSREPVRGEMDFRTYYEVTPGFIWDINRQLSISAELRYREQEVEEAETNLTESADSSAFNLSLRYDFGRKRISY